MGYHDILKDTLHLTLTLRVIRLAVTSLKWIHLPVSASLLCDMCQLLGRALFEHYQDKFLAAVLATGWFRAIYCSEFTIQGPFNLDKNLTLGAVKFLFDKSLGKDYVQVSLKSINSGGGIVCPFTKLSKYMSLQYLKCLDHNSPFIFEYTWGALNRSEYIHMMRTVLVALGHNPSSYCGYSLQQGLAAECCTKSISDSVISNLGHWSHSPSVYKIY